MEISLASLLSLTPPAKPGLIHFSQSFYFAMNAMSDPSRWMNGQKPVPEQVSPSLVRFRVGLVIYEKIIFA